MLEAINHHECVLLHAEQAFSPVSTSCGSITQNGYPNSFICQVEGESMVVCRIFFAGGNSKAEHHHQLALAKLLPKLPKMALSVPYKFHVTNFTKILGNLTQVDVIKF